MTLSQKLLKIIEIFSRTLLLGILIQEFTPQGSRNFKKA